MQIQAAIVTFVSGALLWAQPDPASLAPLYEQALAAKEKQFGPEHPKVARALSNLGLFLRNQSQKAAAEPYLRRALAIDEKTSGRDSAVASQDAEDLLPLLSPAEAMPVMERLSRSALADVAARNLARLAAIEEARGNRKEALGLYSAALQKEESPVRLNDVALLLDPRSAEPLLRRALAMQEKSAVRSPETAATLNNLANVLLAMSRIMQAEGYARRGLFILEETLGDAHPRVATASSNLADILRAKKDYPQAQKFYERAIAIDEAAYGPRHPEVAVDLDNLAELFEEMGQAAKAQPLRRRAAAIKTGAR